jgi:hypothetical protein
MNNNLRGQLIVGFMVLLALVSGCKHPPMNSGHSTADPTKLAYLIADADRIVITNTLPSACPMYWGFTLTISGNEAKEIISDVSAMNPGFQPIDSRLSWELRFYRDADFLAAIHLASTTFVFGNEEYVGDRGALRALSDRLLKRAQTDMVPPLAADQTLPLAPGETIRLMSTSNPANDCDIPIDPEGNILFLLDKKVHVAGCTPSEAVAVIRSTYVPRYFKYWCIDFTISRVQSNASPNGIPAAPIGNPEATESRHR